VTVDPRADLLALAERVEWPAVTLPSRVLDRLRSVGGFAGFIAVGSTILGGCGYLFSENVTGAGLLRGLLFVGVMFAIVFALFAVVSGLEKRMKLVIPAGAEGWAKWLDVAPDEKVSAARTAIAARPTTPASFLCPSCATANEGPFASSRVTCSECQKPLMTFKCGECASAFVVPVDEGLPASYACPGCSKTKALVETET
jgi:hypothetical protein